MPSTGCPWSVSGGAASATGDPARLSATMLAQTSIIGDRAARTLFLTLRVLRLGCRGVQTAVLDSTRHNPDESEARH
ncbi:hypothetical protein GCM10010452_67490 [Crossiella cryophila]